MGLEEIRACPDATLRIEGWLALLEHIQGTFERKGTATLEVIAPDAVYRPLGDLLRSPVAALIRALVRDVEDTPSVDRHAVFLRAWDVLRHGWIEVMRHAPVGPAEYRHESALLATLASTPELARAWCAHLPTAKKLLSQARKKLTKALDGHDFFLRELAVALERVLDDLQRA